MMYIKKLSVSVVSLIACLAGQTALSSGAKPAPTPAQFQEFKLIPRVNFWGFTGDYTRGEGQALVPMWGDAGHALYLLGEGNKVINDSDWMGGVGFGYRQVVKENIFGGYLIGNYHNSAANNGFYIADLGFEMLGQTWDVNANGYLPFKQKKSVEIREGFAEELLGITTFETPTGHEMFDHFVRVIDGEEAGRGFDAEIGRIVPHLENLRIYLGGYHFDTDDADSINGVEARAVCELNRYFALEGEYNYDNVNHSKAVIGLRFTLGGYSKDEKKHYGISTHLLDPIEHDLAIGPSSTTSIATIQRKVVDEGKKLEQDDIQYFESLGASPVSNDIGPGNVVGSGTFEDPYIGFTPENFSDILSKESSGAISGSPVLYFAPGEYNFNGSGPNFQSRGIDGRFNLPNGWGMFGRIAGYKAPALGNDRALFHGGLDMVYGAGAGSAATTLNSIRILDTIASVEPTSMGKAPGDTVQIVMENAALFVQNASNVILQNTEIKNEVSSNGSYGIGIYADTSTVNFQALPEPIANANSVLGENIVNLESLDPIVSSAYGAYITNSTINFKSGANTIKGLAFAQNNFPEFEFAGGVSNAFAGGIVDLTLGSSSTVVFSGGTNAIEAEAFGQASPLLIDGNPTNAMATGIRTKNISFSGGKNDLKVSADALGGAFSTDRDVRTTFDQATADGIYADDGANVFFQDGINTITTASKADRVAESLNYPLYGWSKSNGIYASGSTVAFLGGTNSITATTKKIIETLEPGPITTEASGIYATNSTINFVTNLNSIQVGCLTSEGELSPESGTWGIFADNPSHLQISGTDIADNELDFLTTEYATITRTANNVGLLGYKAQWIEHFSAPTVDYVPWP